MFKYYVLDANGLADFRFRFAKNSICMGFYEIDVSRRKVVISDFSILDWITARGEGIWGKYSYNSELSFKQTK